MYLDHHRPYPAIPGPSLHDWDFERFDSYQDALDAAYDEKRQALEREARDASDDGDAAMDAALEPVWASAERRAQFHRALFSLWNHGPYGSGAKWVCDLLEGAMADWIDGQIARERPA